MPSIDLEPLKGPFFPNIFIDNQFRAKTQWPPKTTDLLDRVAIVTGANTGLGLESARQLLSFHLSRIIIAVRTVSKGEAAAKNLREEHPRAIVDVWALDMSSYESVQAFSKRVNKELPQLDIAILNAAQFNIEFNRNPKTGHEETIQVNYLSTVLLGILLLPILKDRSRSGEPGRLTIINGAISHTSNFNTRNDKPLLLALDDPQKFVARDRYPVSKLLGQMFIHKLGDYVAADDVIANVVCPGLVKGTALQGHWPKPLLWIAKTLTTIPARTVEVGATTYVDAAVIKGKESHASFVMSWEVSPFVSIMYTPEGKQIADTLWEETLDELRFANVEGILTSMRRP